MSREDLDLDHLAELVAKATPGPWFAYDRGCGWEIYLDEHGSQYAHKPDGEWARQLPEGAKTDIGEANDAEFIAAARTALPSLLARLRAAEETLAAVGALAEEWRAYQQTGFYPEASAHANAIENCGDALADLLADRAALAEGASR